MAKKESKVFQARFTNISQFEYIHKTTENVKKDLESQLGACTKNQAIYHIFKVFNNGHETDVKSLEDDENEKIIDFYEQPEQRERIINLLEKKHLTLSEQSELLILSKSFDSSFPIQNIESIKKAIRIYYLKTESEPIEIKEERILESYYCGECECVHHSRGLNYKKHLEFAIEYVPEKIEVKK